MVKAKVIVVLTLFLVMTVLLSANLASADITIQPWDYVYKTPPIITVNLPFNNSILYAGSYLLNITVKQPTGLWLIQSVNDGIVTKQMLTGFGYVLDGKVYGSFPTSSDLSSPINYFTNLTLVKGLHTLQVYANATGCVVSSIGWASQYFPITGWSDTIYFESLPAEPSVVVQPLDVNGRSLSLNFTVDEPVTKITYSIDNQNNVSIAGNTTLTNLPYGSHNLTVYATNRAGDVGASQAINFTISEPKPFPISTEIIIASAIIAIVCIGFVFLLYRRHRKTANLTP